ncbi:DEAD-box type RNA helicase [Conoideocrella luteorostrata]|uniref:DEAD-box type RNA helicase n=1 Tax=Conoideocrella luteorostrata TaxID=1105319 RepID=A0AAJ0G0Z2_9HYPO|nr:DEAD-box type RNA helicase [Conoideocrella luteorostrata]
MSELNEELSKWYEELQKLPPDCHLLCPKIGPDDNENYKTLDGIESDISADEKKQRVENGNRRIEITYWNSLIFGFDKTAAGKWLEEFKNRIEGTLRTCSDCVLNWHMQRPLYLQKFSEKWNEDVILHIQDMLDRIDVGRIEHNLTWAKEYISKIEDSGIVFKKARFGDDLPTVLIAIYEALCCMPYMAGPEQRAVFQYVFMRLQGKTYLKLGSKDPLPGMTFFLFDQKNEDRREWAQENWKAIDAKSITEAQFDWAVSAGLVNAIEEISRKDLNQPPVEVYLEIERFWEGFEIILTKLPEHLILSRLRSMELRPGSINVYDLLFRHIACRSEGVLVVTIRVITTFFKESPKALWDVVGDARPNVIADLLFGSPFYKTLLNQSLDDCWSGFTLDDDVVPFPTSWIQPWLLSLTRDHRYDACEVLMHTLFGSLAKDPSIGEPGQSACIRAGFDAMHFTMKSFLDPSTQIVSGTINLYASAAFNLVGKHKDLILENLRPPRDSHEGWTTFKVSDAAKSVFQAAMKLDMKMFSEEFQAIHSSKQLQSTVVRNSEAFWEGIVEMFDASADQVSLAKDILISLGPLISVEQIRPRKSANKLDESSQRFNTSLSATASVLTRILTRISEVDTTDLNMLFTDRLSFQAIVGLSVHDDSNLAEGSAEILKNWTGELSRSAALQHMSQFHPDQTLSSIVWTLERIMKNPFPWGPIRPLLNMSRDVLQGLSDPTIGVLRTKTLNPKSAAIVLRWWNEQWRFVSKSCLNIESWSFCIPNSTMTEFCREIMELAEALIAEDGLLTSATALGKSEREVMPIILGPAKDNFRGMENMIRLKDRWLVDVTVRVLCKILTRLRENKLEINAGSRKLITDACIPTGKFGKYIRSTNLNDQQRAELLQALGHDEDVQIIQLGVSSDSSERSSMPSKAKAKAKTQSKLDAWSKSAPPGSKPSDPTHTGRTNRDDVLDFSRSADSPILRQLAAQQAKAKVKVPDHKAISSLKESRQREKAEKAKRDAEAIARAKKIRGETVPGEGSGINGLGVIGKDHGRSEIMVNSSDEDSGDDSDDSDSDRQLANLSTGGQKGLDEQERRRQQALRDRVRRPVKKVRQQRSVKEMRARLVPPMDRLHNTILAWDIFHEGNDPPNGPAASEVATKYSDPRSYQATFFPLLASEAWRSFVTAKDEITSQAFGMKIASRASVDSFLEIAFTMPVVQNRERGVSEGDILLVSEAENPLNNPSSRHCLARVHRITYKKDLIEITYRVASRNNQLSPVLTPGVSVHGIKVTNMTTIEREYAALESLQYYDLMDEILKAEPSPIIRYGDERISNAMQNWALNRGQAMAVLGAHENDGFTLIQGPPGTGKTKTITAMVGSLLSEQLAQTTNGVPVGAPLRPLATPTPAAQGRTKKLLVCAPSNAAVDELVLRLKGGVRTTGGKTKPISVLRLGRSDAINAAVKDVTLDELVRNRLEGDNTKDKAKAERDKLHEDASKIKDELSEIRQRLDEARAQDDRASQNTFSRKFDELKRQQMQIGKQIDANKDSGNSLAREMEMRRRQVQQEILNSAHVICATLSGSGHEMFRNLDVEFETVIIDEAAQCVELSALIPLKYGCCKCILVGDPKQLPPTVLSQSAARFGYDQSLFVRMQQNHPKSVHLLDMQYRMHPEISKFPSTEFYEGQLQDGQDMLQLRRQPWHNSALLSPYRFFDVEGVQAKGRKGRSLVNTKELDVAIEMYERFRKEYEQCDLTGKIGIITPYKAQLFEMRKRFISRYGENITDIIEFNTTDAFQGRECEIIIFSCVRASSTGGIGFMTDIRRMNVGLTRAKSSLWVLGDSRALVQGEFWKKLIEDAKARDRYTKGDILGMFRRPLQQVNPSLAYSTIQNPSPKDIDMEDAPSANEASDAAQNNTKPYDSSPYSIIAPRPDLGEPSKPPRDMTNNKTNIIVPREGGPPTIHTSNNQHTENKKRALDGSDFDQQSSKRIATSSKSRGGLMGKFGGKPMTQMKPPKDPSAMSVLGMVPPERPPARTTMDSKAIPTNQTPSGSTSSSIQPSSSMANTKPMNKPPPQALRKKAKPSLFMPKKR